MAPPAGPLHSPQRSDRCREHFCHWLMTGFRQMEIRAFFHILLAFIIWWFFIQFGDFMGYNNYFYLSDDFLCRTVKLRMRSYSFIICMQHWFITELISGNKWVQFHEVNPGSWLSLISGFYGKNESSDNGLLAFNGMIWE